MRLFVAVAVPAGIAEAVYAAAEPVRRGVGGEFSWVPAANFHFTLAFLGEVAPERVGPIEASLATAARLVPPFTIALAGGGAFPGVRRPRVAWMGVEGDFETFRRLAGRVARFMEDLGFAREKRPFSPHLTLGRRRSTGELPAFPAAIAALEGFRSPDFTVTEAVLMESSLLPGGARYTMLTSFQLQGDQA